ERVVEAGESPGLSGVKHPSTGKVPVWGWTAIFVVLVASGSWLWQWVTIAKRPSSPRTVVVFPFEIVGGPPNTAYLGHMFADAITVNLAPAKDLSVLPVPDLPSTAAGSLQRRCGDARSLGAGRLVLGRATRVGDSLEVTVNLLDSGRGTVVWGETGRTHE